jgi:RNA polymerase sigma-70 factor (ECF subfamily)
MSEVPTAGGQNGPVIDLDRLATDAQAGDRQALDTFVRTIQVDVWRFCAHLTRPGEADDLAQESLLRVVAHLDRWQRGPVLTWVLGVTRNVCFEHIRKQTRRRTDATAEPAQPPSPDQYGAVEIRRLLEGVPYDQREALVLTQLLGLPYADAADVVGCPIGTIRSRVARGREATATALRAGRDVADG